MRFQISESEFESMFGSGVRAYYQEFINKLNKELETKINPSADVENLQLTSKRKDAGGNIHAMLTGNFRFLEQRGEIGGEFVWLKNLKKFRGKAWSSLDVSSDTQLLQRARDSFRHESYSEAKQFLNAIQNVDELPRSAILLREMIDRRT